MLSFRQWQAWLLLPACIQAVTFDCAQVIDDGAKFNLEKLGGEKAVHFQEWRNTPPTTINTTFTMDICKPLKDKSKKDSKCPEGSRVCAKRWQYRDKLEYLESVMAIAGEYSGSKGSNRALDPKITRLKGSTANSDEKEGVLVELHGGKYPDDKSGVSQKAIIEFLCDKKVSGNEGFSKEDNMAPTGTMSATATPLDASTSTMQIGSMQRRADDKDDKAPKFPDLDKGKSLQFVSYKREGENDVLRLRWKTKHACEDAIGSSGNPTAGWGFFTWLIIIVFVLAASYIIFGSWLNYNRYGARGWDLIPHGDMIRDIPYIVKDWGSNMADRLKGQNSRGGYSAV